MRCVLCGSHTSFFKNWRGKEYLKCQGCNSLMLNFKDYISKKEEKKRYEEHNNDVNDKRYQKFVYPIVFEVLKDYNEDDTGLDFGAGTGPVISKMLRDKDYNIKIYDPFFANHPDLLEGKYDYIVCCEVIEHFHNPKREFNLMKSMLKPGGTIYLKTSLYNEDIDFISWNYKDDKTHVFFYHKKALEWIKMNIGFSFLEIREDLIKLKMN